MTVRTGNGSVSATGFTTALSAHSGNGSLRVRHSSGPLTLTTGNGSIAAGGITSKVITARSDNGSVALDTAAVPDRVSVVDGNGRISVRLPRTRYAVTASSAHGSVDVEVPRDSAARHVVKARTGNGSISVRPR